MRWKIKTSDGNTEIVQLHSNENETYTFKVGSELVVLRDPKNFAYSISSNGLKLNLETWTKDKWRASHGSKVFTLEPQSESASASSGAKEVKTQMPGRILKILVSEGQNVEAHQTLIIMEAMKMENEIRASAAHKISKISVKVGDSVEAGTLLVSFE